MTAKNLFSFTAPMFACLILGMACPGCGRRHTSAVDEGFEDPAIRDVEAAGGVCNRPSYWPDYLKYEVAGDPVVEVEFEGGCLVRRGINAGESRSEKGERIRDAVLTKFHLLPELRRLTLHDTAVTDEGLKALVTLRHLGQLNLFQSDVGDAGLKHLAALENLWDLDLASTNVTNEGMKNVARLRSLTQLNLNYTEVADAGLAELTALPKLHTLSLSDTAVTDTGAEYLGRIANLHTLSLDGTRITDAGLKHLAKLHRLSFLSLNEATVTLQGARDLKRSLPRCGIYLGARSVELDR